MERKRKAVSKLAEPAVTLPAKTAAKRSIFDDEEALADLVKRVYTLERRLQESCLAGKPGTYLPSSGSDADPLNLEAPRQQSTWLKVARFLAQERIGPVDYIARQFEQWWGQVLKHPFYPNQLLDAKAWERYSKSKQSKQHNLKIDLFLNRNYYKSDVTTPRYSMLEDTMDAYIEPLFQHSKFSHLFIYCVAVRLAENGPTVRKRVMYFVDKYEKVAAVTYARFSRDYDAVWSAVLPPGFSVKAKQIYRTVLAELF
jgi:hypothetical protein